ncbi:MAG: glycosyltransferase family 4 protein [Nocardioides sp.]
MRVGLLTQWYAPEPGPARLPTLLAEGLVARGHDVTVVTGFPNYPSGVVEAGYHVRPCKVEGAPPLTVRRVALYPSHDESPARRLANYASFGASAAALGTSAFRDIDALWVNYSPVTVAGAMWAARALYRVPSVVHVLDLWPDTMMASGQGGSGAVARAAGRSVSWWCNRMYASAHSVAYISPGVGRVLGARGVPEEKLEYVPMWADEGVFRPSTDNMRDELGISQARVVVLYAGALGEAQGLEAVIDACALIDDPSFLLLVAGSGSAEDRLKERATPLGDRVRFLGRVPGDRMTALTATADAALVSLNPHPLSDITMPSKTQANLAAGKPLVVAAGGDVAEVARRSGAAFIAADRTPNAIAAALGDAVASRRVGLAALGTVASAYYRETFSYDRGVSRVEALLHEAANRASR